MNKEKKFGREFMLYLYFIFYYIYIILYFML